MYETYFGFKRRPFLFIPDVESYISTDCMEESRQVTERTVKTGEGIALIFGSVGTGKTLLLQRIHQSLESEYTAVFVSNCRLESSKALFCQLSHDLYVTPFASEIIELRLQILDFARQEPTKGVVLLFDDAQYLSLEVLEEIRLLTDSVRGSVPLFRAVLAGTMDFEETLTQPSLEAFNQRIASRCYLEPLNKEETSQYISRQTDDLRIDPAHETMLPLFSEAAKQQIHRLTEGIPRLINQLCGTILQFAAEKEQEQINETVIEEAWASLQHIEVSDESESSGSSVQEPVISPEQVEEIVDQKKKTFQYRQFDSVEFGTLTDSEPMTVKTDSVASAQHVHENVHENEYKPPYPEDDEDFPELDDEPVRNDFSAYRLQIHIPAEDELVEPEPVTLPTETGVSLKNRIDLRKLVLDFSQQQKKYRRKHLIRKIQHRLGLFAGLHITAKREIPLIQEPEMTTETLQEYGAAVLEGRPPFVRNELHYAYQTMDTAPKKEETYPDPKTGTPIILRWHSENTNENGHIAVSYTEFLNQDTTKPVSITVQQPEAKKTTETVHADGETVVRTSLHASQTNLKSAIPCPGLDETFEETHRVESAAISLAELFRSNSSALQQTCELPEFKDLDVTIQDQLETVIKRITKAAEKIELAAEVSEQAGRHVSKAATLVETEVKAALPTYVDLFKELSEFQKLVSAELESVRQDKTEPPKFRTFPRRQVMIERALPTIDVELLLR